MSKDTFLKGALILTVAGIIVKIIGSVNRILLSRLLGGEGIGLYQMAYPIYLLSLSVSSAGIPVAISILVAEKIARSDYQGANRVFKLSVALLTVTGAVLTIALYFGAGWLIESKNVRDPRAYYAILALAPAIFFVTILSSFRGYFQGMQRMTPTAISQILEQFIRVVTMIVLAYLLMPRGLEFAAAGASFGAAPGAAAGLFVLMYFYWRERHALQEKIATQPSMVQESGSSIIRRIVNLALPVSLANIMLPVVASIDLLIVPKRLEVAGYTVAQATELFGHLEGMAVPLLNLPTILTASLAASLVPAVSEAFALRDTKRIYQRTATAMRISNILTIPSFAGMCLLATPISQMLFKTPEAGVPIAILSFGIILLGIHQVTTGVLQGLGYTSIPLVNMLIAAGVKIGINWVLTANPAWGIKGAALATNADFGVAALLNMYFVYRYVKFAIDIKETLKTIGATIVMGLAVVGVYHTLATLTGQNTLPTLAAIAVGGLVYGLAMIAAGGLQEKDIAGLPKVGSYLVRVLKQLRLIR